MRKLEAERVRAGLASLALAPPEPLTAANGYARAAATLAAFDPARLRSADIASDATDLEDLLAACIPVDDTLFALDDETRTELLTELFTTRGKGAVIDARVVNEPPPSALQNALDGWLFGHVPAIDTLDADQARAWLRVERWLDGVLPGPTREQLLGRLTLAELLEPLQRLAQRFFGREDALGQLRAYLAEPLDSDRPPLMIYGRGGVGKSSLIGAVLTRVAETLGPEPILWAYLDYDRCALDALAPITLLSELVRQIAAQQPGHQRMVTHLMRAFSALGRESDRAQRSLPGSAIDQTGAWLGDLAGQRLVLIVVDTFEEVLYHGVGTAQRVWELLRLLRAACPNVRPLLVSRVPFTPVQVEAADTRASDTEASAEAGIEYIELTGLDHGAALDFLRAQLSRPLSDKFLSTVMEFVDSSPLSLLLAADVLKHHDDAESSFAELAAQERLVGALQDSYVQGFLYRRILDHLHRRDPVLERLAHASLAVRRITAEVVCEVLSPACELGIDTHDQARARLADLGREIAFVEDTGECLRHRPELRKALAGSLVRSLGRETLRRIHDRAISYYQVRGGAADGAEAAYHRQAQAALIADGGAVRSWPAPGATEEDPWKAIENPWAMPDDDDVVPLFNPGRDAPSPGPAVPVPPVMPVVEPVIWPTEMPRDYTVPVPPLEPAIEPAIEPAVEPALEPRRHSQPVSATDLSDIAGRVDALLTAGAAADASRLLDQHRPDPPGWQLAFLTARALAAQGKAAAALPWLVEHVLDALEPAEHSATLVDATLLAAELADSKNLSLALIDATLARRPLADIDALRLHIRSLALRSEAECIEVADLARTLFQRVGRRRLAERPVLVRELAAQLGETMPATLTLALERVGIGRPSDAQLDALADGLWRWQAGLSAYPTRALALADAVGLQHFHGDEPAKWQQFVYSEGRELDRALLSLSHRFPQSWPGATDLLRALAGLYRDWRPEHTHVPMLEPVVPGQSKSLPGLSARRNTLSVDERTRALARIRDILVDAYPTARQVNRLTTALMMDATTPAAAGYSQSRLWFEVLDRAERAGSLDQLYQLVLADERVASYRPLIHPAFAVFGIGSPQPTRR